MYGTSFKLFSGRLLETVLRYRFESLCEPRYLSRYSGYRLRTGRPCCWDLMLGKRKMFIFPKISRQALESTHTATQGMPGSVLRILSRWGTSLAIHLHLLLMLRMRDLYLHSPIRFYCMAVN
jgi:hypothetical protein